MVEMFSSRLPLYTLCEILGVPEPDRAKFLHWMHYLELAQNFAADAAASPVAPSLELIQFVADFNANVEEMFAYGQYMLHKRRSDPQSDLMSAIARANANKHIAFGYGPHVCLGKRVAQIQLEEAYRQLLARLPDIEWTGDIDIAPNNFVHAIRKLGVRYTART
jgi:cytochrome P450